MRGKVIGKVSLDFHQISTSTQNPEYEHQFRESTHITTQTQILTPTQPLLTVFLGETHKKISWYPRLQLRHQFGLILFKLLTCILQISVRIYEAKEGIIIMVVGLCGPRVSDLIVLTF